MNGQRKGQFLRGYNDYEGAKAGRREVDKLLMEIIKSRSPTLIVSGFSRRRSVDLYT